MATLVYTDDVDPEMRELTAGFDGRPVTYICKLQTLVPAQLTQADSRYRRLPPLTADIGGWYSVGFSGSPN